MGNKLDNTLSAAPGSVRLSELDFDSEFDERSPELQADLVDAGDHELIEGDPDRYRVVREQGRGGLGRVMRARDVAMKREVAVKMLLREDSPSAARFVREALITARLQHPGVVPVHEAGRWPSGEPYYSMKLIEGRTLKALIREATNLQERLALLPHILAVAETLAYAHSEGVIHRDIKPSNIVVGEFGETVVLDWGLARDTSEPEADSDDEPSSGGGQQTAAGAVMGTPAYMAPEQASGKRVDERADVFALGGLLYETLSGRVPYSGDSSQDVIKKVIAGPPEPLETVESRVPADLAAIVRKSMARDPDDRYPSAVELAEDLRRFQTGQLVGAHNYTARTLLLRWMWRFRAAFIVAAVALGILAVVGWVSVNRIIDERNSAKQQRTKAQVRSTELVFLQARASLAWDPTATIAWLKEYPTDGKRQREVPGLIDEARSIGVARHVLPHHEVAYRIAFSRDGKRLFTASHGDPVRAWNVESGTPQVLGDHKGGVAMLAVSPDGATLATGGAKGNIVLWDLASNQRRGEVAAHKGSVKELDFSADGKRLVSRSKMGEMSIWDTSDLSRVAELEYVGGSSAVSPDGATIARAKKDRTILIHDGDGKLLRTLSAMPAIPRYMALSPKGDTLAVHGLDGVLRLVDTTSSATRSLGELEGRIDDIWFTSDGTRMASAGDDGTAHVWDLKTNAQIALRGHKDAIYEVMLSRDGTRLLSAGDDATARLWRLTTGEMQILIGHRDDVFSAVLSPDGKWVATTSLDRSVRIWPTRFDDSRVLRGTDPHTLTRRGGTGRSPPGAIGHVAFVDAGKTLISHGHDGETRAWKPQTGDSRVVGKTRMVHEHVPSRPAVSADGRWVAGTNWKQPSIDLLSVATGERFLLTEHKGPIIAGAFSDDSRRLVTASRDGRVLIWDVTTREPKQLLRDTKIYAAAISGPRIAISTKTAVQVWNTESGKMVAELKLEGGPARRLALSRDGRWLVDKTLSGPARLWELSTKTMREVTDGNRILSQVAFSPDSRRLALTTGDRNISLYQVQGGKPDVLIGHRDLIVNLAFSPDSKMLASASYDTTIRLWDTKTKQSRILRGHDAGADSVSFNPEGTLLASAGRDATVRIWDLASIAAREAVPVRQRLDGLTSARVGKHDRVVTPTAPQHGAKTPAQATKK